MESVSNLKNLKINDHKTAYRPADGSKTPLLHSFFNYTVHLKCVQNKKFPFV